MTIATFSLPIDIPWQRLCVSDDMIDPTVCDRKFPYRWRSSVAVFSYEPPEDQQTNDGMIVSYLKVACTITNFQPDPAEVGITNRLPNTYWNTPLLVEAYTGKMNKSYPCFGAILEVGVAPSEKTINDQAIPLDKYPYFMDFDPKKRELYEMVTQTGEKMSRSLDDVNVRKGMTTSNSSEVLDETTLGLRVNADGTFFGIGARAEGSIQNRSSTKDISAQEVQDIRTTDNEREQRENSSHTTQLTQMYQQLNSYHLGTNRAVFFVLPRPHIIEDINLATGTPLTFVNGPRRLDGIQEFFLVVIRPKEIGKICVEAYLETAHVGEATTYGNKLETKDDKTKTLKLIARLNGANPKKDITDAGTLVYTAPPGWEIDTSKGPGYEIVVDNEEGGIQGEPRRPSVKSAVVTSKTELVLNGVVHTGLIKTKPPPHLVSAKKDGPNDPKDPDAEGITGILDMHAIVHLARGTRTETSSAPGLYITGRGVCCCQKQEDDKKDHDPNPLRESVLWEDIMPLELEVPVGDGERMEAGAANRVRAEIDRMMVRSVNDPNRYAAGAVSFAETQLVSQSVASLISDQDHPDDQRLEDIKGLDPKLLEKIAAYAPNLSRSDLLFMSPAEQRDRFYLTPDEVRLVRRAAIGLEGPVPEPKDRWEYPGKRKKSIYVPNVVGLSLTEAATALLAFDLSAAEPTYDDNALPLETVLAQDPKAGAPAFTNTNVQLSLSTGLSVRIPDVVGVSLSQALVMLRNAGLESEPEIRFDSGSKYPSHQVIGISPGMRSYITPHAAVTIEVSSKTHNPKQPGYET